MRAYEFIIEAVDPNPSFSQKVSGVESGGRSTAVNKLSGATGTYQMMPNTFKGLVAKAKPGDPLYGASWYEHKRNPQLQQAAFDALSAENEQALMKAGVEPNDTNKYVAHFLGAPKAAKVLQDPNAKLGDHLSPIVFKQNPNIKPDMKVSDMTSQFEKKLGGTSTPTAIAAAVPTAVDLTRSVGAADDPAERMRLALLKGEIPDYSKVPVGTKA